jgi:hypothetical protein
MLFQYNFKKNQRHKAILLPRTAGVVTQLLASKWLLRQQNLQLTDLSNLSADFVVPAVMVAGVWVMTPGPEWSYVDISGLVSGTTRTPIFPPLHRTPRRPPG